MNKRVLGSAIIIGFSLVSGAVSAVEGPDCDSGRKKFYTCNGCHGIPGYENTYPAYPVPKLAGQHADYIVSALKGYQSGGRKHGSMQGNAASWSDQDINDIAAYLARFRALNERNLITGNAVAGKQKAASCASCHGEDGISDNPAFPKLAAQYEGYLIKVLKDYKSGARQNPMMNGFAATLSDEDIKDISAYYASQPRGLKVVED